MNLIVRLPGRQHSLKELATLLCRLRLRGPEGLQGLSMDFLGCLPMQLPGWRTLCTCIGAASAEVLFNLAKPLLQGLHPCPETSIGWQLSLLTSWHLLGGCCTWTFLALPGTPVFRNVP